MRGTAGRVPLDDGTRQTHHNFIRRAETAFREYDMAGQRTLEHLARVETQKESIYFEAIGHWEQFLSQVDQAWDVLVRGQKILFV